MLIAVGVLLVVSAIAVGVWWAYSSYQSKQTMTPQRVVLIGESTLPDGTRVAGPVVVFERTASGMSATAFDSGAQHVIPGTSYDRLRDTFPLGGPAAVAAAVTGGKMASTAWVSLDEAQWSRVADAASGLRVSVPVPTTVFTGTELFRFRAGETTLSGNQAVALAMGAESLKSAAGASAVRKGLGSALAGAVLGKPEVLIGIVRDEPARSSARAEQLAGFFSSKR